MTARGETAVVAGIDEAGLGPLLGPLTFGWSAFRSPKGAGSTWALLADAVSAEPRDDHERLVVADSKRVFSRNERGRKRLETCALAFLGAAGAVPSCGRELLRRAPAALAPSDEELARHPWYERLPAALPLWVDPGRLELRGALLQRTLRGAGVELLEAGVRVVPVGALNRSYELTNNKGRTVWELLSPLLRHLFERYGQEGLLVVVDRQGGRAHYAAPLLRCFPELEFEAREEGPGRSEYVLVDPAPPRRAMRVVFEERAEGGSFSVALGSCLAKYARELCMEGFNAWFGALQPGLRPTAGYATDGRRWVREAAPALDRAQLPRDVLVRRR